MPQADIDDNVGIFLEGVKKGEVDSGDILTK